MLALCKDGSIVFCNEFNPECFIEHQKSEESAKEFCDRIANNDVRINHILTMSFNEKLAMIENGENLNILIKDTNPYIKAKAKEAI